MTSDALAQALFKKPTLQDCSLQQVDYLAHQYPYFSTAQLLLLQKTEPHSEAYARQVTRTALHFSDPLQFQYWLQPDTFETVTKAAAPQLFQTPISEEPDEAEKIEEEPQPLPVADTVSTEPEVAALPEVTPPPALPEPAPTLALPEAEKNEAPAITFEPYHTVDYFASQGIKLSQQEATNDKLGKQLKSFTEWLKTMKRLPEATAPASNAAGEHKVEHLAAHSLETADVVTESMAEVWLKQGNTQKAADVYNKLSLRYPAKSAYFAAKIEALKQP